MVRWKPFPDVYHKKNRIIAFLYLWIRCIFVFSALYVAIALYIFKLVKLDSVFSWRQEKILLTYEVWYPFVAKDIRILRFGGAYPYVPRLISQMYGSGEHSKIPCNCCGVRVRGFLQPPINGTYSFLVSDKVLFNDFEIWLGEDDSGSNFIQVKASYIGKSSMVKNGLDVQRTGQKDTSRLYKEKSYLFQIMFFSKGEFDILECIYLAVHGENPELLLTSHHVKWLTSQSEIGDFSPPPEILLLEEKYRMLISPVSSSDSLGGTESIIPVCTSQLPAKFWMDALTFREGSILEPNFTEVYTKSRIQSNLKGPDNFVLDINNLFRNFVKTKLPWRYKVRSIREIEEIGNTTIGPVFLIEAILDVDATKYSQLLSLWVIINSTNPLDMCSLENLRWSADTQLDYILIESETANESFLKQVIISTQQFSNIFEYSVDLNFNIYCNGQLTNQEHKIMNVMVEASALLKEKVRIHVPFEQLLVSNRKNKFKDSIEVLLVPGCEIPMDIHNIIRKYTRKGLSCFIGFALEMKVNERECGSEFNWNTSPSLVSYYSKDLEQVGILLKKRPSFSSVVRELAKKKVFCIRKKIPHFYCQTLT